MASEGERGWCSKLGKMRGVDEVVVEWMSSGSSAWVILVEEVQGSKSSCASGGSKS